MRAKEKERADHQGWSKMTRVVPEAMKAMGMRVHAMKMRARRILYESFIFWGVWGWG